MLCHSVASVNQVVTALSGDQLTKGNSLWARKPIVSRRTQAVKLLKTFFHFVYSLNKKNILGGYSFFFISQERGTINLQLAWVNLYRNDR